MTVHFGFDVSLLPVEGGLSGDPSCLSFVNQFLKDESNYEKVINLIRDESGFNSYLSLIDLLLIELMGTHVLRKACREFYEDVGQSFQDLYSAEIRLKTDSELRGILEQLVSYDWSSWSEFKTGYDEFVPL